MVNGDNQFENQVIIINNIVGEEASFHLSFTNVLFTSWKHSNVLFISSFFVLISWSTKISLSQPSSLLFSPAALPLLSPVHRLHDHQNMNFWSLNINNRASHLSLYVHRSLTFASMCRNLCFGSMFWVHRKVQVWPELFR